MISIITASIAAVAALIVALINVWNNRDKRCKAELAAKLDQSMGDVAFLLQVEALYKELLTEEQSDIRTSKVRGLVRASGLNYTGKFTPGRAEELRQRFNITN